MSVLLSLKGLNMRHRWEEEHRHTQMASRDHQSPSHSPNRRTQEWDEQGPEATKQGGRSCSESQRRQGIREWQSHSMRKVDPRHQGAGLHMAHQASGITNCPHPFSPHGIKW